MSSLERFQNVVLGGGEAGKYIAWELARLGQRVAVVEKGLIGGSCPNIACLPSKNVIHSAKVVELVRHAETFGLHIGPWTLDMAGVQQRKRELVDGLIAIHKARFAADGLEFILGEGRFVAPRTIEVRQTQGGIRHLEGERVFLDLGTRAAVPDIPGLADAAPLTHVEALDLDRLPAHLIVLGGGYVGLEMAQAFRRFGSRVTVIEQAPQLIAREDPDVADSVRGIFADDGIDVVLNAAIEAVNGRSGVQVKVRLRTPAGEREIDGSDLLVAAGRTPNTRAIGLESAGVELDLRGYVKVNERLETTAPAVWAMGECAGSPQFTHVAFDDFRVVRGNLAGGSRTTRDRLIPYCMFIDPELGRVGFGEAEAKRRGIAIRVARLSMNSVLRARTTGETRGFMKALIDAHSDRILGFTMLGAGAGEVIAAVQSAMLAGLAYTGLRDAILTHPTMAEGLSVLLAGVPAMQEVSGKLHGERQ
ncbi:MULTISPECIES: mercuric reductase [unclassified Mesorhizobium]|uniref:mercuric reductase n=1 Tax=unclassified Mesorhizobium TaxID=325217 RepID=UPI0033351CD2